MNRSESGPVGVLASVPYTSGNLPLPQPDITVRYALRTFYGSAVFAAVRLCFCLYLILVMAGTGHLVYIPFRITPNFQYSIFFILRTGPLDCRPLPRLFLSSPPHSASSARGFLGLSLFCSFLSSSFSIPLTHSLSSPSPPPPPALFSSLYCHLILPFIYLSLCGRHTTVGSSAVG